MNYEIRPYQEGDRSEVIALSMRAWDPVFAKLKPAVPDCVYKAFYPDGWQLRQAADIANILDADDSLIRVAVTDVTICGWVGIKLHPLDRMGEIHILAVDPPYQRQGIGRALIVSAIQLMRDAGMEIVMVETGDDPGHTSSRSAYLAAGFERWPVARYFRKL